MRSVPASAKRAGLPPSQLKSPDFVAAAVSAADAGGGDGAWSGAPAGGKPSAASCSSYCGWSIDRPLMRDGSASPCPLLPSLHLPCVNASSTSASSHQHLHCREGLHFDK